MTKWTIPLSDVTFDEEEVEAVSRVIRSGWVTLGEEVAAFEDEFAASVGAAGAVAVANGTAALHLACIALGVGPGREVVVPTLSFVASANAVRLAGGTPVFADICGPRDLTLDPEDVVRRIGPATVGVMTMHYGGHPSRMDALRELCRERSLFLLEDAAHAPGGRFGGAALGTLGEAGCFSFFGNKNLTTAEGGMVVAHDPAVLEEVRLLRSHGMTTMSWDRYAGHAWSYDVVSAGYNYRPTELTGAMGRVQLRKLPANTARRRELLARYRRGLEGAPGLSVPFDAEDGGSAHLAVVLLDDGEAREPLRRTLAEEGIQTSVHYPPIHLFRHYRETQGTAPGDFPRSEDAARRVVSLPLHPRLTDADVDRVCATLLDALSA